MYREPRRMAGFRDLQLELTEWRDSGDVRRRNAQIGAVYPDPELHAPAKVVLAAPLAGVKYAHIEQAHPALVLRIEPTDVGVGVAGIEHHGYAVQLVPLGVQRPPRETVAHTATPKYLSNAFVNSPAMS